MRILSFFQLINYIELTFALGKVHDRRLKSQPNFLYEDKNRYINHPKINDAKDFVHKDKIFNTGKVYSEIR